MEDEAYAILHTHDWQAGMMVVNSEDIVCGAYVGVKLECSRCEDIHPSKRPCPHASEVTLELWGYTADQIKAIKATLNCGICGGDAIDCAKGCEYDD